MFSANKPNAQPPATASSAAKASSGGGRHSTVNASMARTISAGKIGWWAPKTAAPGRQGNMEVPAADIPNQTKDAAGTAIRVAHAPSSAVAATAGPDIRQKLPESLAGVPNGMTINGKAQIRKMTCTLLVNASVAKHAASPARRGRQRVAG